MTIERTDCLRRGRRGIAGAGLCCAVILASTPASARESGPPGDAPGAFVIRGSVRSRTEAIDGQFRAAGPGDDLLWSLRTDIFAEYDAGAIRIGGELRDARGYFQKRGSTVKVSDVNALEPLQAYVAADLGDLFASGSTAALAAGRFTLEIGSARLVGTPDFTNSVNSYTGARFDWRSAGKDRLTLFWTLPSTRLPGDPAGLRHDGVELDRARGAVRFAGGSVTKAGLIAGAGGEVYAYHLRERDSPGQPTRDRDLLTYGARLFRAAAAGTVDFDAEAARQTGRARATAAAGDRDNLPVAAQFVHVEIGHTSRGRWSPRVSLHADQASGDDADPRRYTRFDPLFGAGRPDFGPLGLYGPIARSNLISGGVRVEAVPGKRLDGFVMARAVRLDVPTDGFGSSGVRDARGRSGRHAGSQIEARVRYWMIPRRLRLEGGGAYFAKGRFLHDAPNAPATGDTRYAYLDITTAF